MFQILIRMYLSHLSNRLVQFLVQQLQSMGQQNILFQRFLLLFYHTILVPQLKLFLFRLIFFQVIHCQIRLFRTILLGCLKLYFGDLLFIFFRLFIILYIFYLFYKIYTSIFQICIIGLISSFYIVYKSILTPFIVWLRYFKKSPHHS